MGLLHSEIPQIHHDGCSWDPQCRVVAVMHGALPECSGRWYEEYGKCDGRAAGGDLGVADNRLQ